MAIPQNFRTAFNGFNRDDVVRYLEYLNTKHQNQLNQLNQEAQELRSQLAQQPQAQPDPELETLRQQVQELTQQLEQAQQRCQELEEAAAQQPTQLPPPQAQELHTYRRAEQMETLARQRSELVYHQTAGILAQATGRVDNASSQLTQAADQVLGQIAQLQVAVSGSKQALQDAAALMKAIRPNP